MADSIIEGLKRLYDDVKDMDISDPVCMDKVISYLEELYEESEEFMEILEQKIDCVITWKQPWYQREGKLTRPLNEISGDGRKAYKDGPITFDERCHIEKNWQKFVQEYDVPDKLICLARWRNTKKLKTLERVRVYVVAYLGQGLKRNRNQVYKYIVSHYGGVMKGKFTREEERIIDICSYHNPRNAALFLVPILGREQRGVYKRVNYAINGKPPKVHITWTLPKTTKFVKSLMKHTGLSFENLKNASIEPYIWAKLEAEFDQQKSYLRFMWDKKLHTQLFAKCKVSMVKLRIKILKVLRSSPYKVWSDIRWREVAKKFPDGFTMQFLYNSVMCAVHNIKNYLNLPLETVVEEAIRNIRVNTPRDRVLQTLTLNEHGDIEAKTYKEKLIVVYF